MRKKPLTLTLWLFLLLPAGQVLAQTGTIAGTVTDSTTGAPLPGVNVVVEGLNLGSATDAGGQYRITGVPVGEQVVVATFIGYRPEHLSVEVEEGVNEVELSLAPQVLGLENVVVTALGIERKARSLGSSVQEVSGAELAAAGEMNLISALSGKVAGVNITSATAQGGAARIVIRGANSLTGNNQPLFVVDGVPVSNASPSGNGYGDLYYGNAIQDLSPSDIESVSVLKGPNAAALYGSRAANGVVVITTKDGAGTDGRLTFNSTLTFETPLILPTYQNKYGQGFNGEYKFVDGQGGGTRDYIDESWGPPLDEGLMITQWWSDGKAMPWVSHPNNIRNFFETGLTARTHLSFATSSDNANVRLSISDLDQNGMYPGFRLERTTAAVNGSVNLTDRLRADASVQYITGEGRNRAAQGYDGDNFMLQFVWFGRQISMERLRDYKGAEGNMRNWSYYYHSNPYWIAFENENFDESDRIIGNVSVSYDVTDWLTATVRSGTDWSREHRKRIYVAGTIGVSGIDDNGGFDESSLFWRETNTDFRLSATRQVTPDISLEASFGGNRRYSEYESSGTHVRNLVVPGVFDRDNAAITPSLSDYLSEKRVNSLYGQVRFGYKNWLFLNATGRNDWSSTLPEENNAYFYPSATASFIFSDALGIESGILSYGKLRAGWAQVGNDAAPYQLASVYVADDPFGDVPMFGASNRIPNASLKPEITESWEVGAELGLFQGRARLDATYYHEATSNQIIPVQISPQTGFTSRVLNAGKISNRGVELLLNLTPVRLRSGFEWDLTVNFAKNENRVEALYGDLETVVLGEYYGLSIEAHEGEPYGALYGVGYQRDDEGRIIVGSNGVPLRTEDKMLLGHYTPDWTAGLRNTFRYKGFELSVLFDTKQGGEIYSLTNNYGTKAGTLIQSLKGRQNGLSIEDGGGFVVDGVKMVDDQPVPNDIRVTAQEYWRSMSLLNEAYVYDATFIKLRQARLTYTLPPALIDWARLSNASVSLIGRNLVLFTDVPNIDPETAFDATNVQGIEYGQPPPPRSIGFSLAITL